MKYIDEMLKRKPLLEKIRPEIEKAYEMLKKCYENGNKVLICGNGGSAADSSHITGELMKAFKKKRPMDMKTEGKLKDVVMNFAEMNNCDGGLTKYKELLNTLEQGLPTIDLTSFIGLNTAFINDKNADYMYANAVLGLGKEGDILLAISTSGNSKDVINACLVAKAKSMNIIGLTGKDGGKLKNIADISMIVPLDETFLIQEEHISIYHALCLDLEENFF